MQRIIRRFSRRGVALVVAAGLLAGVTLATPAASHVGGTVGHLWNKHIKPRTDKRYFTRAKADARFVRQSQSRFIDLQPYGAQLGAGAAISSGFSSAGIRLPDGAGSSFAFGFTVPFDYSPGTDMTLHLIWRTPDTSCGFRFLENFASVSRPGRGNITSGGSVSDGIQIQGGNTLTAPSTANVTKKTLVTVKSPDPTMDLRRGDSYLFGLFRSSGAPEDTCTDDLIIRNAYIRY